MKPGGVGRCAWPICESEAFSQWPAAPELSDGCFWSVGPQAMVRFSLTFADRSETAQEDFSTQPKSGLLKKPLGTWWPLT